MFQYIIWDFDGTLFDTYPGMVEAFVQALGDYGIQQDIEYVYGQMKISVGHARQHFATLHGIDAQGLGTRYAQHEDSLHEKKMAPYPNAMEICRDFKESGGINYIYTHRNESVFRYLKYHEMDSYFDDIVTKEHGFFKPDPDGFLYIIDKYNLDKEKVLAVGDRDIDIIAAQEAGVKSCLINYDDIPYRSQPNLVVSSLNDLYEILKLGEKIGGKIK